jgi:hypothetical protein
MNRTLRLLTLGSLVITLAACSSGDLSDTDGGGVALSMSIPVFPQQLSVTAGVPTLETIVISSIVKDPTGTSSSLMNVELESLEFVYTREDTGTRLPPRLVVTRPGVIPVNGALTISGQAYMLNEQLIAQPLKDLEDFGRDTETNSVVVRMRVTVRAFGRTLSGEPVATTPTSISLEVVQ